MNTGVVSFRAASCAAAQRARGMCSTGAPGLRWEQWHWGDIGPGQRKQPCWEFSSSQVLDTSIEVISTLIAFLILSLPDLQFSKKFVKLIGKNLPLWLCLASFSYTFVAFWLMHFEANYLYRAYQVPGTVLNAFQIWTHSINPNNRRLVQKIIQ